MVRVMAVVAMVSLVSACAPPMPSNEQVAPPAGADEAIALAAAEWGEMLDRGLDDPPPVLWFAGECLEYPGVDQCIQGAHSVGGYDPEIHLVYYDKPSDSSLAHELLHWALDRDGSPDADHTSPWWDEEPSVVATLRGAGL